MNQYGHGSQVVSSDIVLGTSGTPVAVYGVNIISDGTAGVVILRDGTAGSGDVRISLTGTASKGVYIDIPGGIVFPTGCYVDIDAHVTPSCTVVFEQLS